jgi:hypothetical protein
LSKKSNLLQPKLALAKLGVKLMLMKCAQHESQMLFMFFFDLGVYEDIINKHHYELVKILHEYLVHEIHEIDGGICQSKGHHGVLIQSITSGEGSLGNAALSYLKLVINGPKINFLEDMSSIHLIKQIFNPRERVFVFDGNIIEFLVIHTKVNSTILLINKDYG